MTWVRRTDPPPAPPWHQCTLPNPNEAKIGDLWRCDTCGDLWRVAEVPPRPNGSLLPRKVWRPARWWQRLRYRDRGKVATPPATGAQVMSTRMADGYDPPSASLNPQAYRPEKIRRGGQVPAPNAKEPPVRNRVPKPPADTSWITMEDR